MAVLDFGTAALVFGVFGLVLAHLAREDPGWRRLCVAILAAAMASAVAEMPVRAAAKYQVPVPGYRALLVLRSVAAPLPTLLVFAYIQEIEHTRVYLAVGLSFSMISLDAVILSIHLARCTVFFPL